MDGQGIFFLKKNDFTVLDRPILNITNHVHILILLDGKLYLKPWFFGQVFRLGKFSFLFLQGREIERWLMNKPKYNGEYILAWESMGEREREREVE